MKILNADPQPVFREGIRHLLQTLTSEIEFYQADSIQTVLDTLYVDDDLDLILFDLDLLDPDDLSPLQAIKQAAPSIPIIVLASATHTGDIEAIMATGVKGYIAKSSSAETLLRAAQRVLDGGRYPPRGVQRETYRKTLKRLTECQSQIRKLLSLPTQDLDSKPFFSPVSAFASTSTLAH